MESILKTQEKKYYKLKQYSQENMFLKHLKGKNKHMEYLLIIY